MSVSLQVPDCVSVFVHVMQPFLRVISGSPPVLGILTVTKANVLMGAVTVLPAPLSKWQEPPQAFAGFPGPSRLFKSAVPQAVEHSGWQLFVEHKD